MINPKDLSPGQEQFEKYQSRAVNRQMVHYDYRHTDGQLFSCVAHTLLQARRKRDRWLEAKTVSAAGQRASVANRRKVMLAGLPDLGLR